MELGDTLELRGSRHGVGFASYSRERGLYYITYTIGAWVLDGGSPRLGVRFKQDLNTELTLAVF